MIPSMSPNSSHWKEDRIVSNNEGRFYQQPNNDQGWEESEAPNPEEGKTSWSDIWSKEGKHKKDAEWLKEFCEEIRKAVGQEEIDMKEYAVKEILRKFLNGKAPGPDGVQGFWLKNSNAHTLRLH